jgi:hypothetical protein
VSKSILTLFVLFISIAAVGQVKVDVNASGKHQRAINKAKEAKSTAQERKQQADRIAQQIKAREEYKRQYDSLKVTYSDTLQQDSIETPEFTERDSLAIAEALLSPADLNQYKELLAELPEEIPDNADSLALAKAKTILEDHAKSYLPSELNQSGDPLKELPFNPFEGGVPDLSDGVPEIKKPSKPNPNLVKPDQARELFKKIDPKQFEDMQNDIKGLKEKYSELPDTRFPEEGVKRNSLEDVPFKKRINLGGNFSVLSTDPFILDTNLQLGYWINKKWMSGLGFILRENFGKQDSLSVLTGDSHGFSLYTRYDIAKGFFGWVEMDQQINQSFFQKEETVIPVWEKAYLLGIGREFKIGPIRMSTMILYDFNYLNNNLNARPLVYKMGIQFSKKPE